MLYCIGRKAEDTHTHTDYTDSLFTFIVFLLSSQFAPDFPSGPDFQGALAIGNGSEDREDPWNAV